MMKKILFDDRFGYVFLFSLAFATAFFYLANNFIFELFFGAELMLFNKLISLVLVPMLVGAGIGCGFSKLINIKMKWKSNRANERWIKSQKK